MIEPLTTFNVNNAVRAVFCTPALWEYGTSVASFKFCYLRSTRSLMYSK